MSPSQISPTAIISKKAELGNNITVGPYSIIGDQVTIGDNGVIMHHSVIERNTRIGENCKIHPFCSIGTEPQDITFKGEDTWVEMGSHNIIREFTTINRGTQKGGQVTSIGNHNYLMVYSHIAHDCQVGNGVIFINGATLAGHVEVEDSVVIGAFSSVHQFVRIGRNAYIGGYSVILQDILPFAKVSQSRDYYNFYGPNSIGMMRNGISRDFINKIKDMFNIIFHSGLNTTQAIEKLKIDFKNSEESLIIIDFIAKTKRGIFKNFKFNV
ncbi:MAG: acyl-ACP--UDP-N-acetylglucosamine O-acyltransferase [Candidatus Aminicenantes bacterium]|nr:acyl-ACP--UDP-N-acetylglucosamine O-acyltransferase [Candidatus Aminicenantes bacterium]